MAEPLTLPPDATREPRSHVGPVTPGVYDWAREKHPDQPRAKVPKRTPFPEEQP
jgi:hypothetical protein